MDFKASGTARRIADMKTVWKFQVPIDGQAHSFQVPRSAELAHVGMQTRGAVMVWLVVYTEAPIEEMKLRVFGTGQEIPEPWEHVGTVQDDEFVWHVFEEISEPLDASMIAH